MEGEEAKEEKEREEREREKERRHITPVTFSKIHIRVWRVKKVHRSLKIYRRTDMKVYPLNNKRAARNDAENSRVNVTHDSARVVKHYASVPARLVEFYPCNSFFRLLRAYSISISRRHDARADTVRSTLNLATVAIFAQFMYVTFLSPTLIATPIFTDYLDA